MAAPPVKSGYISSGPDLQLNYLEWGDPSAPPVLLIIGLTNFAYAWNETALADRYRCVALNLRGHGDSGPSPEREYSFDLWDTDVQALGDHLRAGQAGDYRPFAGRPRGLCLRRQAPGAH